jgi:hypothetical protein
MKKLLLLLALTCSALGQGVRYDGNVTVSATNVPAGAQAPVFTLPYAVATACSFPAVGSPCTNTVPIYSDVAPTQALDNPLTADSQGRFGFWIAPGIYSYSVQKSSGVVVGTYTLSLNTIGINASPGAGQTIAQPSGTALGVNNFNNTTYVTGNGTADNSAAIQTAVNACSITCNIVLVL